MSNSQKILIIEDDDFIRKLISQKLEREGYLVNSAIEGVSGLKMIENEKPDLVLLDIILPGIDGFEILRKKQSNSEIKDIPVIILSNLGEKKNVDLGLQLGARDYVVKAHHTLDEIIKKIKKVIK